MKIKRSLAAILAVSMCMASTACSEQAQQTKTTDTSAAQSSQSET